MGKNNLPQNNGDVPEVVHIPVTGTIDLHMFHPSDVKELLFEYLKECMKKGIPEVTIIHGKGTGMLRERVHRLLSSWDFVAGFHLGGHGSGNWGITVVTLKKP